jgi:hypothetical protein
MCKIGINLDLGTPTGTQITRAIGRYRPIGGGEGDWISFEMSLAIPETPNIVELGSYELQVNVTNNINDTSEWSDSVTFKISLDCGDTPPPPPTEVCHTYTLIPNNQKQIWGVDQLRVDYDECGTGTFKTITIFPGQTSESFCASRVWSVLLNADHLPSGGQPVGPSPVNIGSLGATSTDDGQLENNNGNDICTNTTL